jgi:hypothetical protein
VPGSGLIVLASTCAGCAAGWQLQWHTWIYIDFDFDRAAAENVTHMYQVITVVYGWWGWHSGTAEL